jgi:hypothetical protein
MRVDHQEVIVAYGSLPATALRPSMDSDVLPEDIIRPYIQPRVFAPELQILWLKTNRAEGKEMVVLANGRRALNDDMRLEAATGSDTHASPDLAIRTDDNVWGN